MSNLENLTKKILDDANNRASIIKEDSEKVNKEIINSKINEANEKKSRLIEKAASEAILLKERVISNAELKIRNEKLKAKQQVIERVFSLAKTKLENLNEDDYAAYLSKTLKTIDIQGHHVLIVPEKFRSKVIGLSLPLIVSHDETVESGFLIKGDGVILNYNFNSLVDYYRDELEGEIAQSLFKE